MSYLAGGGTVHIEGQSPPAGTQPPATFLNHAGHGYFETMQIPIVRGRAFTRDDEYERATTRRLAIVNEAMAEQYWPGQDPIGKRLAHLRADRAAPRSRRRRAQQQVRRGVREDAARSSICRSSGI